MGDYVMKNAIKIFETLHLTWLSHQRRRKRKQKRLNRNSKPNVDKTLNGVGFNHHLFSTDNVNTTRNHTNTASELPRFENTRPDDDEDLKSEISSNEDKNILSSVRFSRLVDSRRISKDYYALLQKEQEKYALRLHTYLFISYYIKCFYVFIQGIFKYFYFIFQFKAKIENRNRNKQAKIERPIWKAE